MGKAKRSQSSKRNIFKVAGANSLKLKNKARAVTTTLKKVNEIARNKTAEVDQMLTSELRTQLLQRQKQNQSSVENSKPQDKVMKDTANVDKVSSEAMNKLREIKM